MNKISLGNTRATWSRKEDIITAIKLRALMIDKISLNDADKIYEYLQYLTLSEIQLERKSIWQNKSGL
jgi:hypothetical protein